MKKMREAVRSPRTIGVACAVGATGLGLAYMAAAGAPTIYLAVNAMALLVGLAAVALASRARRSSHLPDWVVPLLGAVLLGTAMFGVSVDGASRWIRIGGLSIQVSLLIVPAMLLSFVQRRNMITTAGMVLAAVALAAQPDRAMAGVLAASLAVLAVLRSDRWAVSALTCSAVGFVVSLIRPDALPAVPFVDQILYTSFSVSWLAGLAVTGGSALLVVPAIVGRRLDPDNRDTYTVFGAIWFVMVVAAAMGNYPTPVVGYGGGAVLGYALSLSLLPRWGRSAAAAGTRMEAAVPGSHGLANLRRTGVGSQADRQTNRS